jgi:hypothetical protein
MDNELELIKELYEHINRSQRELDQKEMISRADCHDLIAQIKDRIYVVEYAIRKRSNQEVN